MNTFDIPKSHICSSSGLRSRALVRFVASILAVLLTMSLALDASASTGPTIGRFVARDAHQGAATSTQVGHTTNTPVRPPVKPQPKLPLSGFVHLGRSTNAARPEALAAGHMIGERLTVARSGTLTKIYVYLDGKAGGRGTETISASIYGEQTHRGEPVRLLAKSTSSYNIKAGMKKGWYSFDVNLKVGAMWDVWVFFAGTGNSVVNLFKDGTGTRSVWSRIPHSTSIRVQTILHRNASTNAYSLNVVERLAATPVSPSGVVIPLGNLPGWTQVFAQDFNIPATSGTSSTSFKSVYANTWCGYDEGDKYFNNEVLSAHSGVMDFTLNGTQGAAGSFNPVNGTCGQTYGRFSIRFKADGGNGYGTAMMLWPNSNIWGDGEVDYPEGGFTQNFWIHQHATGCANCPDIATLNTQQFFTAWHTATTEWTASGVKYYLDNKLIKSSPTNVPTGSHRMTVQMAPDGVPVAAAGHLLIDWVAIYTQK